MMEVIMLEKTDFLTLTNKLDQVLTKVSVIENTMSKDRKLYNITEAAKELHITRQTLHSYINLGLIEPLLIGNTSYFTKEIIDNFLKQK